MARHLAARRGLCIFSRLVYSVFVGILLEEGIMYSEYVASCCVQKYKNCDQIHICLYEQL